VSALVRRAPSAGSLEERLRRIGAERYHDRHAFHRLLHGGHLNKGQIQAWALNRYYYQASLPIKDALVLSKLPDRSLRQEWLHRITDHDGLAREEGGIDRWLKLTDLLGLDRDYVQSTEGILPATRFAVDAYVNFVRHGTPLEAVASSLAAACAALVFKTNVLWAQLDALHHAYVHGHVPPGAFAPVAE
jgi:pyrroloquinoline-quinone synthase